MLVPFRARLRISSFPPLGPDLRRHRRPPPFPQCEKHKDLSGRTAFPRFGQRFHVAFYLFFSNRHNMRFFRLFSKCSGSLLPFSTVFRTISSPPPLGCRSESDDSLFFLEDVLRIFSHSEQSVFSLFFQKSSSPCFPLNKRSGLRGG